MDETYVNVTGRWCDRYRAIDRDGNLGDARLSETRDMHGAQRFFRQAVTTVGHHADRVTTDAHDAYPRAVQETLGDDAGHRCSRYRNNRIEQDHRGLKQRYNPMRGFGRVASAVQFCPAFEEQRQYFRARQRMGERVSLAEQRRLFRDRWAALLGEALDA